MAYFWPVPATVPSVGQLARRLTDELEPQAGREATAQSTGAPRGNIILPELNKELSV